MLDVSTPPDDLHPPADIEMTRVTSAAVPPLSSSCPFLSFPVDELVSCAFWTFEGFSSVRLFLMSSVATVTTVNACVLFNED